MPEFYEDRPSFRNLQGKEKLVGVEIGVDSGWNAQDILLHLDIHRLYLVDPWCGYNGLDGHGVIGDDENAELCYAHTVQLMKPFGAKAIILRALSEEAINAIPNDLDFVYIDGNHRYQWVLKDMQLYWPKIKVGGFLMGHDHKPGEQGVIKAAQEFFNNDYNTDNWDWWKQKRSE